MKIFRWNFFVSYIFVKFSFNCCLLRSDLVARSIFQIRVRSSTTLKVFHRYIKILWYSFYFFSQSFLLANAGQEREREREREKESSATLKYFSYSHAWKSATRVFHHSHEFASCCSPSLSILDPVVEHVFEETSWSPLTLSYIGYRTRFRWLLCSGLLARRCTSEKVEFDVRAGLEACVRAAATEWDRPGDARPGKRTFAPFTYVRRISVTCYFRSHVLFGGNLNRSVEHRLTE